MFQFKVEYQNRFDMALLLIISTVLIKLSLNFQINQVNSKDSLVLRNEWFEFNPHDKIVYATSSVNFEDYNEIVQNEQLHVFYKFDGSMLRSVEWDWVDYDYYILINKDGYTTLKTIFSLEGKNKLYAHGKYLLIVEEFSEPQTFQRFFGAIFRKLEIYNVIVMNNNKLFTWYPYNINCNITVHEISPRDLAKNFRNKLPKTLNKCELRVGWFPVSGIAIDPNNSKNPGSIIKIMNVIGNLMNVSINYVYDERIDGFKLMAQHGHNIYIVPNLYQTNVSLVVYSVVNTQYGYYSNYIIYDIYQGIILPPRRRIPKWMEFKVFSNELILATIISILVSGYVFAILTQQSLFEASFRIYRLCFQLSLDSLPRSWKLRIYFMFLMFFIMEISAAYLSCLSGVFTRPSLEPKITTLQEFMDSDIPLKATTRDINIVKSEVTENKRRPWVQGKFSNISHEEDFESWKVFYEYNLKQGYAIFGVIKSVELERFGHIITLIPFTDRTPHAFVYRPSFHLKEVIDEHILHLHESGLMPLFFNPMRWIPYDGHEMIRILDIADLSGVFVIWLWGLAISTVAFTFEIIHFKRQQRLLQVKRRLMIV